MEAFTIQVNTLQVLPSKDMLCSTGYTTPC